MKREWCISGLVVVGRSSIFGRFEQQTPLRKRLGKWGLYLTLTALLGRFAGRPWTFAWILGLPLVGATFHVWYRRKHGINPLTAEPRDQYYRLRGWPVPQ